MFYSIEKDKELTFSDVKYFIDRFTTEKLGRLSKLDNYYKNDNEINRRVFEDESKPNNKIPHSFADYIVKTNVAMLLGSPIAYNSSDDLEEFNNLLEIADEQDINVDIATNCSKYGYAVQLLYLNKDADVKFHVIDNKQCVLIYSDSIEGELLYCIRFWKVTDIDFKQISYIEVYSKDTIKRYKDDILQSVELNMFVDIPVIVYKNNSDGRGDYENIISLIDEYDLITSDTANENDYFNNAYLFLNTDSVDIEDIKSMKESRVLFGTNLNPQFIIKQSNNTDLENEKNRIVKDIHKLSFVPDLSDENFANNVSGVAMKYKLFGTLNNIATKQRKFKKSLSDRNKLLFEMMYLKSMSVPSYVDIIFTTTLPENALEVAQTINQLRGLVSDETLVSQLPFIQDASWEVEQAKASSGVSDIYSGDYNE